ncbi:MAG: anhydro-N-acetylmuramic acid kinase [Pseudomonadota bacterium]|nr:anhydro-N-acetylmuramic acid kinase [Pseudomonadota bacterium]
MGLFLGMMSGTSMDAIDAALVDFDTVPLRIIATSATAFDATLKRRISGVLDSPAGVALDELGEIDVSLAQSFAAAALALLRDADVSPDSVTAIGSHGQTLRHRPHLTPPFTWQIGDPNTLTEMTGITVVADFRRRDVAAGGQGAPLLPVFHDQVFRSDSEDRVIVNLGGIANVTVLRRGAPVTGFDTGPANRLLDAWISLHLGKDYDTDGAWAGTGRCDDTLLRQLMDEPFLRLPPPKSTGRELFNLSWLRSKLGLSPRRPEDVQATLQQYTAASVAAAVHQHAPGAAVYICGGGAHNTGLRTAIARLIAPNRVNTTAFLGLDPDYVEAVAFAWFARRTLEGLTSSAVSVTGARGARILGGVYRYA